MRDEPRKRQVTVHDAGVTQAPTDTTSGWQCSVHAPKATPRHRLEIAIDMAQMHAHKAPRRVLVHPLTAAELGDVATIEVVARQGLNREVYQFPANDPP